MISNPGGAEPLAFEAEVGDLIKGTDHPEVRIEFQAVYNLDPVGEPDVLRAQITVSVHNAAVADTLTQGAAGGEYGYPVPLCNSKLAQFGGNQLRPAQIERHQRLNNVHDSKP